jgi:hypothetical protein
MYLNTAVFQAPILITLRFKVTHVLATTILLRKTEGFKKPRKFKGAYGATVTKTLGI